MYKLKAYHDGNRWQVLTPEIEKRLRNSDGDILEAETSFFGNNKTEVIAKMERINCVDSRYARGDDRCDCGQCDIVNTAK